MNVLSSVRRRLLAVAVPLVFGSPALGVVRIVPNDAAVTACTARLAPARNAPEMATPCNALLRLEPGTYDAWLEAEQRITPFPTSISIRQRQREETFTLPAPSAPAGRVAVTVSAGHRTIELLHLQAHRDGDQLQRLFRRATSAGAAEPPQFPAGPLLAVARDQTGAPVAVSRPVSVRAAMTNDVVLAPPERDRAVLVIELALSSDSHQDLTVTAGGNRPDAVVVAADRLLAVWYDRAAGSTPLRLDSKIDDWQEQTVELSGGHIAWIEGEVRPRPSLHVTVTARDPVAIEDELRVKIQAAGSTETIESAVTLGQNDIAHVPVAPLDVRLTMGKWLFQERADTSHGGDASVVFELNPAIVKGVVIYGVDPVRAEVAFTSNDKHSVQTDERGEFTITLWTLRRYGLVVTLPDYPQVPMFADTLRISGDRELELRIPKSAWRVGVVDAKSGEKIGHATVYLTNAWKDDVEGNRSASQRVETDDRGETLLPPLRPGTVELRGEAGGYVTSEPVTRVVAAGSEEVFVPIALHAADEPPLRIMLADGEPAAGAAAAGLIAERIVWTSTADAQGFVSVPAGFDGPVAIRHPKGASDVRGWRRDEKSAQWTLEAPAPPLRVRVVDHAGEPVPSAMVGAWFGEFRVTGTVLSFLVQAPPFAMTDGSWVANNLPARPFRIVALQSYDAAAVTAGAFDAFFVTVPYPWPGNPQLKVAD